MNSYYNKSEVKRNYCNAKLSCESKPDCYEDRNAKEFSPNQSRNTCKNDTCAHLQCSSNATSKHSLLSKCDTNTCPYSSKSNDQNKLTHSHQKKCNIKNCPNIHTTVTESSLSTTDCTKWPMNSIDKYASPATDIKSSNCEDLSMDPIREFVRKKYGTDKFALLIIQNSDKKVSSTDEDIFLIDPSSRTQKTCKQDKFSVNDYTDQRNKRYLERRASEKKNSYLNSVADDFNRTGNMEWDTPSSNIYDNASSSFSSTKLNQTKSKLSVSKPMEENLKQKLKFENSYKTKSENQKHGSERGTKLLQSEIKPIIKKPSPSNIDEFPLQNSLLDRTNEYHSNGEVSKPIRIENKTKECAAIRHLKETQRNTSDTSIYENQPKCSKSNCCLCPTSQTCINSNSQIPRSASQNRRDKSELLTSSKYKTGSHGRSSSALTGINEIQSGKNGTDYKVSLKTSSRSKSPDSINSFESTNDSIKYKRVGETDSSGRSSPYNFNKTRSHDSPTSSRRSISSDRINRLRSPSKYKTFDGTHVVKKKTPSSKQLDDNTSSSKDFNKMRSLDSPTSSGRSISSDRINRLRSPSKYKTFDGTHVVKKKTPSSKKFDENISSSKDFNKIRSLDSPTSSRKSISSDKINRLRSPSKYKTFDGTQVVKKKTPSNKKFDENISSSKDFNKMRSLDSPTSSKRSISSDRINRLKSTRQDKKTRLDKTHVVKKKTPSSKQFDESISSSKDFNKMRPLDSPTYSGRSISSDRINRLKSTSSSSKYKPLAETQIDKKTSLSSKENVENISKRSGEISSIGSYSVSSKYPTDCPANVSEISTLHKSTSICSKCPADCCPANKSHSKIMNTEIPHSELKYRTTDETDSEKKTFSPSIETINRSRNYSPKIESTSNVMKFEESDAIASSRRYISPEKSKKIQPTRRLDEVNSSRRTPSKNANDSRSTDGAINFEKSGETTSRNQILPERSKEFDPKYKKLDETESSRKSRLPNSYDTRLTTKYKQPDGSVSSRSNEASLSRSSSPPKNINEVRALKPKFKISDEKISGRINISPDKIKEYESTGSAKFKRLDETASSRSPSPKIGIEPIGSASKIIGRNEANKQRDGANLSKISSSDKSKEYQPTSIASNYKKPKETFSSRTNKSISSRSNETTLSRRSPPPKNINEVRSLNSSTKFKKSDETIAERITISPDRIKDYESTNNTTKPKRFVEATSRSPSPRSEIQSIISASKITKRDDKYKQLDGTLPDKSKEFQSKNNASEHKKPKETLSSRTNKSISSRSNYLQDNLSGRSSPPQNINKVRSLNSPTNYKKHDEMILERRNISPDKTEGYESSIKSKYKRSDETNLSGRSPLSKSINEDKSISSTTKYKRSDETISSRRSPSPKSEIQPRVIASRKTEQHETDLPISSSRQDIKSIRRRTSPSQVKSQIQDSNKVFQSNSKSNLPHITGLSEYEITSLRKSVSQSSAEENQSISPVNETKFKKNIGKSRKNISLDSSNDNGLIVGTTKTSEGSIYSIHETPYKKKILSHASHESQKMPHRSASQTGIYEKALHKETKNENKGNIPSKNKVPKLKPSRKNVSKSKINKQKLSKNSISNSVTSKVKSQSPNSTTNENSSLTRSISSQDRAFKKKKIILKNDIKSPPRSTSRNSREPAKSHPRENGLQMTTNKIILEVGDIQSPKINETKQVCHQSRICCVRENRCSQLRRNHCCNKSQSTSPSHPTSPCPAQKLTNYQILSKLTENYGNLYCKMDSTAKAPPRGHSNSFVKEKYKAIVERPCSAPNRTCKSPCRKLSKPQTPSKITSSTKLCSNFNSNIAFIERPCSAPSKACRVITCSVPTTKGMQTRKICYNAQQQAQLPPTSSRQYSCRQQKELLNQVANDCRKQITCNRQTCKQVSTNPLLNKVVNNCCKQTSTCNR